MIVACGADSIAALRAEPLRSEEFNTTADALPGSAIHSYGRLPINLDCGWLGFRATGLGGRWDRRTYADAWGTAGFEFPEKCLRARVVAAMPCHRA
jgi:hypothetical protein